MENKLIVSVAGIRGIYPNPLSPDIVYKFGLAFGIYADGKKVFVARDTRKSGTVLKMALMTGLAAAGRDIIDLDISSTPQLTYLVENNRGVCGVVISASHNPENYNGLKFVSSKGTFLNEKEGAVLLDIYSKIETIRIKQDAGSLVVVNSKTLMKNYFDSIYRSVNVSEIKKRKFKVVVDVCQGVGAFYTHSFLKHLKCEVVVINPSPPGIFSHNPEPLPESLQDLSHKTVTEKADIGFAQDPDGDRLAVIDENGCIPGEDMTLALCVQNVLEKKRGPVVVNLSTSMIIEHIAGMFHSDIYRTKIGEVNVVEGMKKYRAVIGGEGNGGVILPSVHYGRDSFVGMALILEHMAIKRKPLSEIIGVLPRYTMLKKKFLMGEKQKKSVMKKLKKRYELTENINLNDGIKIIRNDGWIHIRPSGTEPILRVYIEAINKTVAKKYLLEITRFL